MKLEMRDTTELADNKHLQYLHAHFIPATNTLIVDSCLDPAVLAGLYTCIEKLFIQEMSKLPVEEQLAIQAYMKGMKINEED